VQDSAARERTRDCKTKTETETETETKNYEIETSVVNLIACESTTIRGMIYYL